VWDSFGIKQPSLVHFPVRALTSRDNSQSNLLQRCYISPTACVSWSKESWETLGMHIDSSCTYSYTQSVIEQLGIITKERCKVIWVWCARSVIKIPWENVYSVVFFYEIQYCFCNSVTLPLITFLQFQLLTSFRCTNVLKIPVELLQNSRHFKGF